MSPGANSRASKSWVDSMVKQVLSNLHRGVPLSEAGGMSNGMVSTYLDPVILFMCFAYYFTVIFPFAVRLCALRVLWRSMNRKR
jgi:hypothetical protein